MSNDDAFESWAKSIGHTTTCHSIYALRCKCARCTSGRCAQLVPRYTPCVLLEGHRGPHRYEVDGAAQYESTDQFLIGRLTTVYRDVPRHYLVSGLRGYGVITSLGTTNGSARFTAQIICGQWGYEYARECEELAGFGVTRSPSQWSTYLQGATPEDGEDAFTDFLYQAYRSWVDSPERLAP